MPWLKALADESRFAIIKLLITRPMSVRELAEALELTQYNTSKSLRILREQGLVEQHVQGRFHEYAVTPELRRRLSADKTDLDLGCCLFHFDGRAE